MFHPQKLQQLEKRIEAIEIRLGIPQEVHTAFESTLRLPIYQEENKSPSEGSYGSVVPWTSKQVHISEQLTSFEFAVKAQMGQAALFAFGGTVLGAAIAAWQDLQWFAAPVIGVVIGTTDLIILVLDHRGMLHKVISEAGNTPKQKPELRITVAQEKPRESESDLHYLYLNGAISRDDLRLMASGVMGGKSLAVHAWVGVGGRTRTKVDNFMAELKKMDYARPGRGNIPGQLTRKGKALFKALAQ